MFLRELITGVSTGVINEILAHRFVYRTAHTHTAAACVCVRVVSVGVMRPGSFLRAAGHLPVRLPVTRRTKPLS